MVKRTLFLIYGLICYSFFLVSFVYAVGFVSNFFVPKSMDTGVTTSLSSAILINLSLLGIFAVQHSVMARQGFKKVWTKIIPEPLERSTYVLFTSLALMLLFWQWQPINLVLWDLSDTVWSNVLWGLCVAGWLIVFFSTFVVDHFDLFGLRQVYLYFQEKEYEPIEFKKTLFYKYVRHPILLGFIIAFWATPIMSAAHLIFAGATLVYTFIGIFLEERDLVSIYGEQYQEYRKEVPMLVPKLPELNTQKSDA
ncbi:MAG: methanethiol S-methyltransferase [Cyanobacteria bacterium P01_A01_bin.83]